MLGAAGEKSVRVTWDDVAASRPDVVVVAPCGYDRAGAQAQADALAPLLPAGSGARRRRRRDVGPARSPAGRRVEELASVLAGRSFPVE